MKDDGADRALVSVRLEKRRKGFAPMSGQAERFIHSHFSKSILETFIAIDCPGAASERNPAKIFVLDLDRHSIRIFQKFSDLTKWYNPDGFPEDLCLFSSLKRYPSFTSVTHDGDAFFIKDKYQQISDCSDFHSSSKDMHITGDYYFCTKLE
jgi:hypothetical protein